MEMVSFEKEDQLTKLVRKSLEQDKQESFEFEEEDQLTKLIKETLQK